MGTRKNADLLACSSPDNLVVALREAAYQFRADAADLASSWQDDDAGRIWDFAAGRLEAAADAIERQWAKV